jgi:hypothetical protein
MWQSGEKLYLYMVVNHFSYKKKLCSEGGSSVMIYEVPDFWVIKWYACLTIHILNAPSLLKNDQTVYPLIHACIHTYFECCKCCKMTS